MNFPLPTDPIAALTHAGGAHPAWCGVGCVAWDIPCRPPAPSLVCPHPLLPSSRARRGYLALLRNADPARSDGSAAGRPGGLQRHPHRQQGGCAGLHARPEGERGRGREGGFNATLTGSRGEAVHV